MLYAIKNAFLDSVNIQWYNRTKTRVNSLLAALVLNSISQHNNYKDSRSYHSFNRPTRTVLKQYRRDILSSMHTEWTVFVLAQSPFLYSYIIRTLSWYIQYLLMILANKISIRIIYSIISHHYLTSIIRYDVNLCSKINARSRHKQYFKLKQQNEYVMFFRVFQFGRFVGFGCSAVVNKLLQAYSVRLMEDTMRGVLGDEAPGTPPCSIDPGPRSRARAAVHRVQSTADVSATHVSSPPPQPPCSHLTRKQPQHQLNPHHMYSVVVNNL